MVRFMTLFMLLCIQLKTNAQISTPDLNVEPIFTDTQIDNNTVINGDLSVISDVNITGSSVSNATRTNVITDHSGTEMPSFPNGLLSNTVASFEIDYISGTIDVGTMQRGDVWLVTAALKSYGPTDNRGGSWMVAYSGNIMVIHQFFKVGTVSLYDAGGGLVRYHGGGGAPKTTVAVLKLTD